MSNQIKNYQMVLRKLDQSFLSDRKNIVSILIYLLIATVALSSLQNGGVLSTKGVEFQIIVFSVIILGYISVIAILRMLGADPNKIEMLVLPGIIISILFFAVSLFTPEIIKDPSDSEYTEPTQAVDTSQTSIPSSVASGGYENSYTQTIGYADQTTGWSSLIFSIILIIFFVISVVIFLNILLKREKELPEIHLAKEREYTKELPKRNKEIMEYYIDASNILEKLRGKAPKWFSPTGFADKIKMHPGPPVASYFEILTDMYEIARFSANEMTREHVMEANSLLYEIQLWANDREKELVQYE